MLTGRNFNNFIMSFNVCKNGHLMTQDNLVIYYLKLGKRVCKTCQRIRSKYRYRGINVNDIPENGWIEKNKNSFFMKCGHVRLLNKTNYGQCKQCENEKDNKKRREVGITARVFNPSEEHVILRKRRNNQIAKARRRDGFLEDVDREVLFERDKGICGICKKEVHINNFHVDHIIPISKGGKHCYENTQISHPSCNHKKHARINFSLICLEN